MATSPALAAVNFGGANVLVLERSVESLGQIEQILRGFGVRRVQRCLAIKEAIKATQAASFDLFMVEAMLGEGEGYEFVSWLRRSGGNPNCSAPVFMLSNEASNVTVARARDFGANLVLVKPIDPADLLQRILRVTSEARAFVISKDYAGPDRRFKFEGPPAGIAPRRASDLKAPLAETMGDPLSQTEIDAMPRPQRAIA